MSTQYLEGTVSEIQQLLVKLKINPDHRLIVRVADQDETERPGREFVPTEFKNGRPILPKRDLIQPLTIDLIKCYAEDDDEDELNAYRAS